MPLAKREMVSQSTEQDMETEAPGAEEKSKGKAKAEPKSKAKAKTEAPGAEEKSQAKAKAEAKSKAKAKAGPKSKAKAKAVPNPKAKAKSEPKSKGQAKGSLEQREQKQKSRLKPVSRVGCLENTEAARGKRWARPVQKECDKDSAALASLSSSRSMNKKSHGKQRGLGGTPFFPPRGCSPDPAHLSRLLAFQTPCAALASMNFACPTIGKRTMRLKTPPRHISKSWNCFPHPRRCPPRP